MSELKARVHEYKIWPKYFAALNLNDKTFEWREDDRDPRPEAGDIFHGREWDPEKESYTGNAVWRKITYTLREGFGMPKGKVILALHHGGHNDYRRTDDAGRLREALERAQAQLEQGAREHHCHGYHCNECPVSAVIGEISEVLASIPASPSAEPCAKCEAETTDWWCTKNHRNGCHLKTCSVCGRKPGDTK